MALIMRRILVKSNWRYSDFYYYFDVTPISTNFVPGNYSIRYISFQIRIRHCESLMVRQGVCFAVRICCTWSGARENKNCTTWRQTHTKFTISLSIPILHKINFRWCVNWIGYLSNWEIAKDPIVTMYRVRQRARTTRSQYFDPLKHYNPQSEVAFHVTILQTWQRKQEMNVEKLLRTIWQCQNPSSTVSRSPTARFWKTTCFESGRSTSTTFTSR